MHCNWMSMKYIDARTCGKDIDTRQYVHVMRMTIAMHGNFNGMKRFSCDITFTIITQVHFHSIQNAWQTLT